MKEVISRKKNTHITLCRDSSKNKNRYMSMKYKAGKAVSKAMKETDEEALTESKNKTFKKETVTR